jgi:hypothetical protein
MMRCLTRWTARVAVLLLLAAGAAAPAPGEDPAPRKCCFSNPSYAGICEVEPAKDETCGQILDYLNNPMAQGKSYCGSTQVRSGWKTAACEKK